MTFRPLHDRVLVKRIASQHITPSGIVLPNAASEKPDQGEVVAVGNGKKLKNGGIQPLQVKVGDRILFGKYGGDAVKIAGEEFLVFSEKDIMATLET